jgi:hypothetical protein
MSRVAGSVHIAATDGPGGRAASRHCLPASLTRADAILCVGVRPDLGKAKLNTFFSVNTLAAGDRSGRGFAGRTGVHGPERFAAGAWSTLARARQCSTVAGVLRLPSSAS